MKFNFSQRAMLFDSNKFEQPMLMHDENKDKDGDHDHHVYKDLDRFGLVSFYDNDHYWSNKCYYNLTEDGYYHSRVKNTASKKINGNYNCNNYASSLNYCETIMRQFIDLYFINSISVNHKLRLKFVNKSISCISDLMLLYFDSCIYQFSHKKGKEKEKETEREKGKRNLSSYASFGKMILFNHFDNIAVANEMDKEKDEEQEKVQLHLQLQNN